MDYWIEAYYCVCSSYWESNRASRYKKGLPYACFPFYDPIIAILLIRLDYIPDINLANKTIVWSSLSLQIWWKQSATDNLAMRTPLENHLTNLCLNSGRSVNSNKNEIGLSLLINSLQTHPVLPKEVLKH